MSKLPWIKNDLDLALFHEWMLFIFKLYWTCELHDSSSRSRVAINNKSENWNDEFEFHKKGSIQKIKMSQRKYKKWKVHIKIFKLPLAFDMITILRKYIIIRDQYSFFTFINFLKKVCQTFNNCHDGHSNQNSQRSTNFWKYANKVVVISHPNGLLFKKHQLLCTFIILAFSFFPV